MAASVERHHAAGVVAETAAAGVARGRRCSNATTIADILNAAKEEFASSGFDGATVDSICRRAKVSKQLLYYYFGSKSDLYTLVLTEAAESTSNLIACTEYHALPPEKALARFIQTCSGIIRTVPRLPR